MTRVLRFLLAVLALTSAQRFRQQNRNSVGVAYGPYVRLGMYDTFTEKEIMAQLNTLGQYFSLITTYGVGAASYTLGKPFKEIKYGEAIIADTAAKLNAAGAKKRFSVNIGVFQRDTPAIQQQELDYAYAAAVSANAKYRGTVTGVTILNEYVTDAARGAKNRQLIQDNRQRFRNIGLQIGTRTQFCYQMGDGSPVGQAIKDIAEISDYIYCNVYASAVDGARGALEGARKVTAFIETIERRISGLKANGVLKNKNLQLRIGETGWPSAGTFPNSQNPYKGSPGGLVTYWNEINRWATGRKTKIPVHMFEAFDEPNKHVPPSGDPYFGLWRFNPQTGKFIEKTGPQAEENGPSSGSFPPVLAELLNALEEAKSSYSKQNEETPENQNPGGDQEKMEGINMEGLPPPEEAMDAEVKIIGVNRYR